MSEGRTFPVLFGYHPEREEWRAAGCPRSVPWPFLEPHEARARTNHSQTLERLAQRGGLGPEEVLAIVRDKGLRYVLELAKLPKPQVVAELIAELERWRNA